MSDDGILDTEDSFEKGDEEAGDFTPVAEGYHEVTIDEVKPDMHDFAGYTGPQAALKMIVDGDDDQNRGRFIFDRINLPHPQEKPGNRKRRAAILIGLGFFPKGTTGDVKFNWKKLEGKRCVVEIEHNKGQDKNGKAKTYANVVFAGYSAIKGGGGGRQETATVAAGAEAGQESSDDEFGDI